MWSWGLRHPVGGFDLKINLGQSQGFCLLARKPAGNLLSSSPPLPPAPAHRAWRPLQVTAKFSLAKIQGHRAAGVGAEGGLCVPPAEDCRWSARTHGSLRPLL